ncbi:DUF1405 domain-containing protein [Neomoorella humiferrea]|uniref:DUF1405 domain-containing protein n=1 Tax=Neomoorella humiferrea TaxID=676965 RepID=UPI003D8F08AB
MKKAVTSSGNGAGSTCAAIFRWAKLLLWEDPFEKWFLLSLVFINLAGSLYGYYWYREQLAHTPVIWWPFIPDSPLATTLFGLAVLFNYWEREGNLLQIIAAAAVIKYGLWAMIIISDFWLAGAPVTAVEAGLWLSHLGMVIEGCIFLRHWPVYLRDLFPAFLWLGLNDFVDYWLGMHPYLFAPGQEGLALFTAVLLSLFLSFWYLVRTKLGIRGRKKGERGRII